MPLRLLVDTLTRRTARTPLVMKADGRTWSYASDTFIDPVTRTVMLRPQVLHPDWYTSGTGDYARLARTNYQKADTSALPSSDWIENHLRIAGDIYLESRGVNYAVFTAAQPINKPMFLSFFVPQAAGQKETVVECGWGEPGAAGTVSLRIRTSGRVEVWKGTNFVGDGTITGAAVEAQRITAGTTGQTTVGDAGTPGTGDVAGRFVNLYLFPCRRRELLIFASSGGGFAHSFVDLPSDVVNTITPAGRFWWYVAQGKASVQCAPMNFPEFGYVLSPNFLLREAPSIGETFATLTAWDEPGYGTGAVTTGGVETDGTTPFVGDGTNYQARIRVELEGDGSNTPFLYAADLEIGAYIVETDPSEVADLSDNLTSVDFFVGEDMFGTRGTFNLVGPRELALFCAGLAEQSNRPFELWISDDAVTWRLFLIGFIERPKSKEAAIFEESGTVLNDRAFKIELPWRDRAKVFEDFEYEDAMPSLDDLVLTTTVGELIQDAGVQPGEQDIEANSFQFPFTPAVSRGEWSEEVPAGTKLSALLTRLHNDYATSWYMTMAPDISGIYGFRLRSESTLPSSAQAVVSLDPLPGEKAVRQRFEEETVPPEITRVAVTGYDPRARTLLRTRDNNPLMEMPDVVPSARPAGWLGTIRPLYIQDGRFTTTDAVEKTRDEAMARFAVPRKIAEWQSELLRASNGVPLWRGNVVGIVGKGRYRIEAFSGTLENEAVGFIWRNINYVGKRIGSYP